MLRVGVIGVGSISRSHIQAYKQNEQVELVALCDIHQERLQEKGHEYSVDKLYVDYIELLQQEDIDAVSICTWNNTHAEIAIAALEANKHVLVEKPLSLNVKEALAVQEAARKSDKIVQVGFVRRHADSIKLLKTFIDQQELGQIYYAKASFLRRIGNPGGWFSDQKKSGGGPLIDLGVHMIDLCWYLMGKPRPVSVSGNSYYQLGNRSHIEHLSFYKAADYDPTLNDVEDLTNALIRFENGASLFVDVSFTLHAPHNTTAASIYGDKGGAVMEPKLEIVTEKHNTIINSTPQIDRPSFDFANAFANEINHFVNCCLQGQETIAPVGDGVQVMAMLEGIHESAQTKKEIYL
ncbi:Gfo/Idh/MocA family protein [Bacillus sp. JCM 19034]|uniref:Gfo/Idh/MocA family protein n=1 Tax=Bacillus sp. JCM 19034 TaxID=1481928 RepID=UPI000780859F|nr:Gfo/Idh/MocA family oxidoreductase [Bacillus sp. JCM 19034]